MSNKIDKLHYILDKDIDIMLDITGKSMRPLLKKNDRVSIIHIKKRQIQVGDIIILNKDNNIVAHRIIKIYSNKIFFEKGDSSPYGSFVREYDIIGYVNKIYKKNVIFIMNSFFWKICNTIIGKSGWLYINAYSIFIPFIRKQLKDKASIIGPIWGYRLFIYLIAYPILFLSKVFNKIE